MSVVNDLGGIETFWDRKLYMKAWYNSNIFMNFLYFSCVIFFPKNVSIHSNHILLIMLRAGVLCVCVTESNFLKKKLSQKLGKWVKNSFFF